MPSNSAMQCVSDCQHPRACTSAHARRYSAAIVSELGQGLVAHSVPARNAAGQRAISFDQWAQLFDWVSHHLGVTTEAALTERFGAELRGTELAQARQALAVRCLLVALLNW